MLGKKLFHHIKLIVDGHERQSTYIQAYIPRPSHLEQISLIESTRSYTYLANRKGCKWHRRDDKVIVQVYPKFYMVPPEDSNNFELFF